MFDIFDDIFDLDGDGETDILEDAAAWDIMLNDDGDGETVRRDDIMDVKMRNTH